MTGKIVTPTASFLKAGNAFTNMDNAYLASTVGRPLTLCLKELVEKNPKDPIEWIAHWLYKYADNECYYFEKSMFLKDLHSVHQELMREKMRRWKNIAEMKANATTVIESMSHLGITLDMESMGDSMGDVMSLVASRRGTDAHPSHHDAGHFSQYGSRLGSYLPSAHPSHLSAHPSHLGAHPSHLGAHPSHLGPHHSHLDPAHYSHYNSARTSQQGGHLSHHGSYQVGHPHSSKFSHHGHSGHPSFQASRQGFADGPGSRTAGSNSGPSSRGALSGRFDKKESAGIFETGIAEWGVNCRYGLICQHPVLGDMEPRPALIYPDTPQWWERHDYVQQAQYDPELYSRNNDDVHPKWNKIEHMDIKDFVEPGPWIVQRGLRSMQDSVADLVRMPEQFQKYIRPHRDGDFFPTGTLSSRERELEEERLRKEAEDAEIAARAAASEGSPSGVKMSIGKKGSKEKKQRMNL